MISLVFSVLNIVSQEQYAEMVGTVSGLYGQNVVPRVVKGTGKDSVHVPIHPLPVVVETAVD